MLNVGLWGSIPSELVPGLMLLASGSWLLWKGVTNDIWRDNWSNPRLPRWMYFVGGTVCVGGTLAWAMFLVMSMEPAR